MNGTGDIPSIPINSVVTPWNTFGSCFGSPNIVNPVWECKSMNPGEIILFIKGYKIYKVGHNPLGSLSIFSFYFVITILTISGLFSSDDIIFDGPLASMDQNLTKTFTKIHNFFHYIIYILIALHIIAILYYQIVKKQKLINQMIDGISRDKKIKNNHLSKESSIFGFFILLFCLIVPSLILFFITF